MTTTTEPRIFDHHQSRLIFVNARLALTNGHLVRGSLIWTDHVSGTVYSTGNPRHQDSGLSTWNSYALFYSPKLVEDPQNKEEVLQAINDGKFDIFPFQTEHGKGLIYHMKQGLETSIKQERRQRDYDQQLEVLEAKYPQVDSDLKRRVRNFDKYYEMSDDHSVYTRGVFEQAKLTEELIACGAPDYMKEFMRITYRTHSQM